MINLIKVLPKMKMHSYDSQIHDIMWNKIFK